MPREEGSRLPAVAAQPTTHIALMVTRRCNMSCGHCSVESGPQVKNEPAEAELLGWVREAAAANVRSILFTGGEPMLREALVLRLLRECRRLGLRTAITTNGFWGRSAREALRRLRALRRAGLSLLTVSYDRYHAEFQGHQPAVNIADAAAKLRFPVNISVVRAGDEPEIGGIAAPFEKKPSARLSFYDIQPVGRARALPVATLRSEVEGFCNACSFPAITDDGRVVACNGPSYFARPDSPLNVGSLRQESLRTLLERHRTDPLLDTIRAFGPARLRDELKRLPGFASFPFREQYHGMCDLCHHITSNGAAVTALRLRLADSEPTAARRAAQRVIDEQRRGGTLSLDYVNGVGGCRTFLRAAWETETRWTPEAEKILGRADLDWQRLGVYLSACGLARPLLRSLKDPELTRWAPRFFTERLERQALLDGMYELVQREAIRRIDSALRKIGSTGILLKGAAFLALAGDAASPPVRATGDIDLYVSPQHALTLRSELLKEGFVGSIDAPRRVAHHLSGVVFQGVLIEIHTSVEPSYWGVPEREMLSYTSPLKGLDALFTFEAEGLMLHAAAHTSRHLYTRGLKTAWDLLWLCRKFPSIDWERLARWVEMSSAPRSIWVPVRVLCRELDIPLPLEFLARAPADARQRRLESLARYRLFRDTEGPLIHQAAAGASFLARAKEHGIFLFHYDALRGFARYLTTTLAWKWRRIARRGNAHTRAF